MAMLTDGSVLGGVISASAYADGVEFVASNRYLEGLTDTCAVDVRSGNVLWRQTATNITYGAVAHANGVVYVGTTDKTLYALDGASGNVLWMTTAPDSIAGGPAISGGLLFVPWGYQWTLGRGMAGTGGLMVFGVN
jgi:outer membrane protein assembly factor BamB